MRFVCVTAVSACLATGLAAGLAAPALAKPPAGMTVAATLSVAPGKDVDTTVNLPAGTRAVNFEVQGGAFTCKSVKLSFPDGKTDNVFTDSDMPDKAHMKIAIGAKLNEPSYTSVIVKCSAAAGAGGQLVIAAGKS